jgi:hypothetical protein
MSIIRSVNLQEGSYSTTKVPNTTVLENGRTTTVRNMQLGTGERAGTGNYLPKRTILLDDKILQQSAIPVTCVQYLANRLVGVGGDKWRPKTDVKWIRMSFLRNNLQNNKKSTS